MSDIDFDELDKAVNSLMASPAVSAPAETAEQPEPKPSEPILPQEETASSAPEESATAQTPTAAPLAKRRGRFMDVVHPSSDMKSSMPAKAPSREGVTIAAPSDTAATPEAQEADVVSTSDTEMAAPETPSTPVVSEWPDPIDVHGGIPEESEAKADEEPSPAELTPSEPSASEPLSSPFLADAKVEKRPLGGMTEGEKVIESNDSLGDVAAQMNDALAGTVATDKPAGTDTPTEETISESQVEPESTPLPAELASDLVAIEAGDVTTRTPVESARESVEAPSISSEPVVVEEIAVPAVEKEKDDTPVSAVIATPALGSITQQYKEEPSSGDETHAAIYDTDTDAAPLVHLTKKKTGWLYVVLIILVLLLGAGGGAAVYFFHLI